MDAQGGIFTTEYTLSTHLMLGDIKLKARLSIAGVIGQTWPHIVASSDNGIIIYHGHSVRVESVDSRKFGSTMQLRTVGPQSQRDGNAWEVGYVTFKAKRGRVIMIRSSLFAFGDFVDRAAATCSR
eukprot:3740484-Amphidinium_carterae.1